MPIAAMETMSMCVLMFRLALTRFCLDADDHYDDGDDNSDDGDADNYFDVGVGVEVRVDMGVEDTMSEVAHANMGAGVEHGRWRCALRLRWALMLQALSLHPNKRWHHTLYD